MILPAMGMVSDIIATFSRKPLFGYKPMVYAIAGIAGLGFIVWGHHMFQSGMDPRLGTGFMLATIMIALPSAVKVFNWLGTIWGGNIQLHDGRCSTPWPSWPCSSSAACSGIFMAATPVDVYIHDTYFIVAHLHYVLFMSSIFGIFAGIYFWFPKMFGRMMNETLGQGPLRPDVRVLPTARSTRCTSSASAAHPRRYFDPTMYTYLGALPRAQPVHDDQRHPAGLRAVHLHGQFRLQPVPRQEGRPQSVAQQLAGMDRSVAAAARQLRACRRSFAAAPMNTACRTWRRIICRRRRRIPRAFHSRLRRTDGLLHRPVSPIGPMSRYGTYRSYATNSNIDLLLCVCLPLPHNLSRVGCTPGPC